MVGIGSETLLTLSQAAKWLPGHPHLATLHRWRMRGINGVKLESVRIGGRRFTSIEALERFSERITAAVDGDSLPVRTSKQREGAIAEADRELAAAGI